MPVGQLKLGVDESRKNETLRENTAAAKLVADLFGSSYGPSGTSKVLLDEFGKFQVTKDGGLMFKEVGLVHPIAKLLTQAGAATKADTGDGSLSTILLAGALIERGWRQVNEGVHPTVIARGYHLALEKALELISQDTVQVSSQDFGLLTEVARFHLVTKIPAAAADLLAPMISKALIGTSSRHDGTLHFDRELVKVEGRRGGALQDSILVDGVVLHKKAVDRGMPKRVEEAKIAFYDGYLGIKRPDMFTKVLLSNPRQVEEFYRERSSIIRGFLDPFLRVGANIILCSKEIDEELRRLFALNRILAVRNVQPQDMHVLRKATMGTNISSVEELQPDKLGGCKLVHEKVLAAQDLWLFFEKCRDHRIQSILVRGPDDFSVDEAKNAVRNCLKVLEVALQTGWLVRGGGVAESRVAAGLRVWALNFPTKEQMAIKAFADALDEIPLTLARNAGKDPFEVRGEMLARGGLEDTAASWIPEPLEVKKQYLKSATEVAITIMRIDHRITQPPKPRPKKSPIPEPVRALGRR